MRIIYLIIISLVSPLIWAKSTQQVHLDVGLSNPYILVKKNNIAYLKVGLTGFKLNSKNSRTAVNVALVLDRSGSMQGEKIERAKQAAKLAISLLDDKDIVSVVSYDDKVNIVVPATKVRNKKHIQSLIDEVRPGGYTALFAGVSKGADQLRSFLDKNKVNRVILLSDGLANVGPSSPSALGQLGQSLAKERISVTTIGLGLGYNEDLMTQLANNSDGNHAFVEHARDLASIFQKEFNDVLSVVAQKIQININCKNGVKPIRILGRKGQILGNKVIVNMNQIYSQQEKYVLLEVEIPPKSKEQLLKLADVGVSYDNSINSMHDKLQKIINVQTTRSHKKAETRLNANIMSEALEQISIEKSEVALKLRDQGRIEEAKRVLKENNLSLRKEAKRFPSQQQKFEDLMTINKNTAENLDEKNWSKQRKTLRKKIYEIEKQQSY